MTWCPGLPTLIEDRLVSEGGWIECPGCTILNLYRPPILKRGNAALATPWVEHVKRIYPDEADHIVRWLAHRVQRPAEKINHCLVLGGTQGIGKDSLVEPAKRAVGPWNAIEITPQHLLRRFNGFTKSVILRVNEARDLGVMNRYQLYDHLKSYTAAPPDVLRVDEKNLREHSVFNVCGVIITTNHKADGVYLPSDDRRHYVAWSDLTKDDFPETYWNGLWPGTTTAAMATSPLIWRGSIYPVSIPRHRRRRQPPSGLSSTPPAPVKTASLLTSWISSTTPRS
jgi:hypothetical protein